MKPSPQKLAVLEWVADGSGSCRVEAVAGAGKTTLLFDALSLMHGSKFFGAYSKNIAVEIQAKTKPLNDFLLNVSTMHAAGFKAWRRVAAKATVNKHKCRDIFRAAAKNYPEYVPFEAAVLDLVSYAKQAAVGIVSSAADNNVWFELIEHFGIETKDNDELVVRLARKTMQKSIEMDYKVIDFDDMIFSPLFHGVKVDEYDWVLVDEAQDTNAVRRALALRMLKRGGRMMVVGDRHQAIFGFTGADADALDLIGKAVNAKEFPLTVTYRCPKAIVAYAQQYVSHIQADESAPEGVVRSLEGSLIDAVKPGDAIVCRFNAPLIAQAYQFISAGIPVKVEGKSIGEGLKNLASRWKVKSYHALLEKLGAYAEKESGKLRAKEKEAMAVAVEDSVECLRTIIERVSKIDPKPENAVDRVCVEIDQMFGDNVGDEYRLLTSIHKAKGREWKNVYWMQTGPSKWARKDWEIQQEKNLCYVAATRAKEQLILCDPPAPKEKK